MKDNQYILNSYDVLDLNENAAKAASYKTILNEDLLKDFEKHIQHYLLTKANCNHTLATNVASRWIREGQSCDLLVPEKHWKKGKVKLALVFEPEEEEVEEVKEAENKKTESPLDDIRQSIVKKLSEE